MFHPDMVWAWPAHPDAHDPVGWRLGMGRFDAERWGHAYRALFDAWVLVRNRRRIVKIEVAEQGDGAFAVVDIDTAWRKRGSSEEMLWRGRVCKVYSLVRGDWKMTMHTGALNYPSESATAAAEKWIETWRRAWPAADVEAIAALYADEAVFHSHPFRARQAPRDYVAWAFGEQAEAECRFGHPVVSGERAAVEWWGVITSHDGSIETVAGTSLLRFGAHGLVVEQRDAWGVEPGHHECPHWAR